MSVRKSLWTRTEESFGQKSTGRTYIPWYFVWFPDTGENIGSKVSTMRDAAMIRMQIAEPTVKKTNELKRCHLRRTDQSRARTWMVLVSYILWCVGVLPVVNSVVHPRSMGARFWGNIGTLSQLWCKNLVPIGWVDRNALFYSACCVPSDKRRIMYRRLDFHVVGNCIDTPPVHPTSRTERAREVPDSWRALMCRIHRLLLHLLIASFVR